ncbi:MAG TPA: hypothetical protein VJ698_13530 [Noviherbaspirillum sp.]|uniref:hypothetical protein n=1 Tax=Noviherbaspirillum sp. TaxID=1926288 RepID=UPI002B493525|nr:hypothetical protein [Noviherbaspirillum sp.]HJV86489.1 hypothetical protein [Noviherbaspirillum sp.]
MKTLYDVLGVDRQALPIDIEHAYRSALNAHIAGASTTGGRDPARLRELREAYLALSSPSRRLVYDQQLHQQLLARRQARERRHIAASTVLLLAGLALIGGSVAGRKQAEVRSVAASNGKARWLLLTEQAKAGDDGRAVHAGRSDARAR